MIVLRSPERDGTPDHPEYKRRLALVRKYEKPGMSTGQIIAYTVLVDVLVTAGVITVYSM